MIYRQTFASIVMSLCFVHPTFSFAEVDAKKDEKLFVGTINQFHPTQATVGAAEVDSKVKAIREASGVKRDKHFRENAIPVVIGPDKKMYMIDKHHFLAAAQKAQAKSVYYKIVQDYSQLPNMSEFWKQMEAKKWVYLKKNGVAIQPKDLPKTIKDTVDDPYRTLAGLVRDKEGFERTDVPFAEYYWADYFREKIPRDVVETNSTKAVQMGLNLARQPEAAELPGFKFTAPVQQPAGAAK